MTHDVMSHINFRPTAYILKFDVFLARKKGKFTGLSFVSYHSIRAYVYSNYEY